MRSYSGPKRCLSLRRRDTVALTATTAMMMTMTTMMATVTPADMGNLPSARLVRVVAETDCPRRTNPNEAGENRGINRKGPARQGLLHCDQREQPHSARAGVAAYASRSRPPVSSSPTGRTALRNRFLSASPHAPPPPPPCSDRDAEGRPGPSAAAPGRPRSEEHTSELQ